MTEYEFPLLTAQALVERLTKPPLGTRPRRWVLRDDNQQHYHGRIAVDDDPLILELRWKANSRGREQLVGLYRLHLGALLKAGYIRQERDDPTNHEVRLRVYRGDRGVVVIQIREGEPALPIGMVDPSLS
jgi:hypothetical protein